MTTIVWDSINLASDTLGTSGNMILSGEHIKTRRVGKYRIAFAGDYAPAVQFFKDHLHDALEVGNLKYSPVHASNNDFTILIVQDGYDTCWLFNSSTGFWDEFTPPLAIGSGAKYAMGALYAGANAEQAVMVACQLDTHSGLPVHVEK